MSRKGQGRLPPQIQKVKEGDMLQFIRQVYDGECYLSKSTKAKCYVYKLDDCGDKAIVVFAKPRRNIFGQPSGATFPIGGFKYCRVVPASLLIENCRRV